jgi:DNA-binding MltR family transcriptional regulator
MVGAFHKESDRGAAILAGSFIEHYLGIYLRSRTVNEKIAEKLFGAMGPLATFSQRIAVAYAFGLIEKWHFDDLERIRKIRNYFAHHPFDGSFEAEDVKRSVLALSSYGASPQNYNAADARQVYVEK